MLSFGDDGEGAIEGVRQRVLRRGLLPSLAANLAAPDPLLPMQTRLYLDRRMRAAVREELASFGADVLHVTLARLAPYARGVQPGVHVHVDFVDALSLNMATRAGRSRLPLSLAVALEARRMARDEARVTAAATASPLAHNTSWPRCASVAAVPK